MLRKCGGMPYLNTPRQLTCWRYLPPNHDTESTENIYALGREREQATASV